MSWEVITPFVQPIEPWLNDPEVSDILVNGPNAIFVEKNGHMAQLAGVTIPEKSLNVAVLNIARVLNQDVSEESPLLDARLPDGSRVAAVLAPCSLGGTTLAIRKFNGRRFGPDELVAAGMLPEALLRELENLVENRKNILIAGGTGSGKTTLLNALATFVPDDERVVLLEDTAEIQINRAHLVRLEARREQPDWPAVTLRDLVRMTLRLRPDRILIGEVRGGEAYDLLQALNTGHEGSLATIHANSARETLSRFTTYVLQSGTSLPYLAVCRSIATSLDVVVHLKRRGEKRLVSEVMTVRRFDASADEYELEPIYQHEEI